MSCLSYNKCPQSEKMILLDYKHVIPIFTSMFYYAANRGPLSLPTCRSVDGKRCVSDFSILAQYFPLLVLCDRYGWRHDQWSSLHVGDGLFHCECCYHSWTLNSKFHTWSRGGWEPIFFHYVRAPGISVANSDVGIFPSFHDQFCLDAETMNLLTSFNSSKCFLMALNIFHGLQIGLGVVFRGVYSGKSDSLV